MKTLITSLLALLIANTLPVQAQSAQTGTDQYKQAMGQALTTMKSQSEKTPVPDMLALANQFERIAGVETKEWLPRYYAGLVYVYLGFMGKSETEKDKFLDQADANVKAAEAIAPDNDELAILKAYIAQSRMTVDPANRWQQYGPLFQENLKKAKTLNANNPRPYVLEGTGLMYTPEQYGGGPGTACPVLATAVQKFATFKPISDLHPNWGKEQIEPMLAKCPK